MLLDRMGWPSLSACPYRGGDHGVEQPEIGRTNARIKPACHVVDHIIGVKDITIGPAHPLAQFQGPGLNLPTLPTLLPDTAG